MRDNLKGKFSLIRKCTSLLMLSFLFLFTYSCKTTNESLAYSTVETVAISSDYSGNYVLKVQGKGIDEKDALKNAKQQAVHDVIFKNLHRSYGDHKMLFAIINDPGMEEKYESFFKDFFSDGGAYNDYVKELKSETEKASNGSLKVVIVNLSVNRDALKKMLMEKRIGF